MPNAMHNERQDFLAEHSSEEYQVTDHLIYDQEHVLDARRYGNILRYINHSCKPNCTAEKRQAYGVQIILIIATQDIAPNTECTIHYGDTKPSPCKCGHCNTTATLDSTHITHPLLLMDIDTPLSHTQDLCTNQLVSSNIATLDKHTKSCNF